MYFEMDMKGELLAAVSKDANNQIFPIIWIVIDIECKDSWSWFINLLAKDLKLRDSLGWTIINNQQKIKFSNQLYKCCAQLLIIILNLYRIFYIRINSINR